jgi:hypothetical protein
MILSWIHNQEKNVLECKITSKLHYVAHAGGRRIKKYVNDVKVAVFTDKEHDDSWEKEKHWLSEHYSDIVGKYEPIPLELAVEQHIWKVENDWDDSAFPLFGVGKHKEYLDRLQRPASVQTGKDMVTVLQNHDVRLMIEMDKNREYWQRPYCLTQETFYNVQPCCVFPDNPGRKKLSKEEAEHLIKTYSK